MRCLAAAHIDVNNNANKNQNAGMPPAPVEGGKKKAVEIDRARVALKDALGAVRPNF